MKHGWKWLAAAAMICMMICLWAGFACADGESGHTLTVTLDESTGEPYVYTPVTLRINAAGAKKLYMTDAYNRTFELSNWWDWENPSEEGWGLNHEHVLYNTRFEQSGDQTISFQAYWADDITDPAAELPWVTATFTVHVSTLGPAGTPTITPAEGWNGSIARGEMLQPSVTKGAHATNCYLNIYSGTDTTGNPVYQTYSDADGEVMIPTWTLGGGTYTLEAKNFGPQYTATSATMAFTVDETEWTQPTGPVWSASKQSIQLGEPVTVYVYVPGAEEVTIVPKINGVEDTAYSYSSEVGRIITSFESSGQAMFSAYINNGRWNGAPPVSSYTITVEPGELLPAPELTCADTITEGSALNYTISAGEGADAPEYSGMKYRVILTSNDNIDGWRYRNDQAEPGTYSFSWAELRNNYFEPGNTAVLRVEAYCAGYETARTEKMIFISGTNRDSNFTISITDRTAGTDGTITMPVNSSYVLQGSGLPEGATQVEYLNTYGYWEPTSKVNLERGIRRGQRDDPVVHQGVMARYRMNGQTYYSNVIFINYYRNGVMPTPQVSFAEGSSPKTVARGEDVRIRIANADAYTGYGTNPLQWFYVDETGNGSVTKDILPDAEGLVTLDTAILDANEEYYIYIMASGMEGISSAFNDSLRLIITEPTELYFRTDKSTVYPGEAYRISGFVPGAVRTRIVKNSGEIFESEYGNLLSMAFSEAKTGTVTYRLEALYTEPGSGEEAVWTTTEKPDVTVTAQSRGDLNELITLTMPEHIDPESGVTLTLEAEGIDTVDRVKVQVLNGYGEQILRAEKRGAMSIAIPAEVPEDRNGYSDFYCRYATGATVFENGNIYRIAVSYTKSGYSDGSTEKTYYVFSGQTGDWLTADGGQEDISRTYGETVQLKMILPAGAKTVRVLLTNGYWDETGLMPQTGSTREYVYPLSCFKRGESFIAAWYSMEETPGREKADWDNGYYSNIIRLTVHCDHAETRDAYDWYNTTSCIPDENDRTVHIHAGRARKYTECAICHEELEDLGEITTDGVREAHNFHMGSCNQCGYVCLHENIGREITVSYQWADATQHLRIERASSYYDNCPDCDEYLQLQEVYTETREDHTDADSNGVCDICGNSITGEWSWRLYEGRLIIEGSGAIPNFNSAEETGWYSKREQIKNILIPEEITSIGANAFGGLTETTRISFAQASRPAIHAQAFSGSNLICRYFTEPEAGAENTWTGTYGAASIEWVFLPDNNTYSTGNLWYYENDNYYEDGWYYNSRTVTKVSRKQAEELTFMSRHVTLYAIPTEKADRDMYEAHWDVMSGVSFELDGTGSYNLTIPSEARNLVLGFEAPGWTLNVNAQEANEYAFGMVMAGGGTLNMTAPRISNLFLRGYYNSEEQNTANSQVTINGDVDTLNYYNTSNSVYRFAGTATINGSIMAGYEYGTTTIRIPNLPEFTESDVLVSRFSNVNQADPIVLNSRLNVAGAEEYGLYTEDNTRLGYTLQGENWWRLQINPLTGDNVQPVHAEINEIKPGFTKDDIYWGDHTMLTLNRATAKTGETLEFTVPEGVKAEYISVMESTATISGEIYQLDIQDWDGETFQVTVDGTVDHFNAYLNYKAGSMTLGTNGLIREGMMRQLLHEELFFENTGAGQVIENGEMRAMSHLRGQKIASIMPTEATLTSAAGLTGNGTAVMTVTDSELMADDLEMMEGMLAQYGGVPDTAFDVSVMKYDTNGNYIENATELNMEVPITVKNLTKATAYVARLHDGTAEKLTAELEGDAIRFTSDLFSKYVLVRTGEKTFDRPDITAEYYLSDNSVLISFPWAEDANYHEITIYNKATEQKAYDWSSAVWGPERSPAEKCMFHVNVNSAASGWQDRSMAPGEYYAMITLKGDGYADAVFQMDFEVFSSLPQFQANSLPAQLTKIEEEAFAGIAMSQAEIPELCKEIGKKAFDGSGMKAVLIPANVRSIGEDAFPKTTAIYTTKGSKAQKWAEENGYKVYLVLK